MIKVENIETFNIARAIYSSRNAMNSWDKSDSDLKNNVVGPKDLKLAKRLYNSGSEHRKYLRQCFVSMDITAPLYWWKEMDQYRINVTSNSCSTMHTLLSRPFEMSDFSFDQMPGFKAEVKQFFPEITEAMEEKEEWRKYDNEYDVSNYGRIRHNFQHHSRIIGGSKHQDGYIFVTLHGKQMPLHRLVAMAFHGNEYRKGHVVNHIDANKHNNFAENLEWVTQKENIKHSHENNLQPRQTKYYKGKLTSEEREKIKELWNNGIMGIGEIAKEYNISSTCVRSVINDKYRCADSINVYEESARPFVDMLNELRDTWCESIYDKEKREIWYSIIQLLPSSFNQMRTITMNYENVVTIIKQRTGHRLKEWGDFVDVLKTLPYIREIMG